MKDVMLDFETLGNGKHAAICQIGACYFDRTTGEIGSTFKANVDVRTAIKSGAEFDADTVYWWLSQSREAIDSFTKGELIPIQYAMNNLNDFFAPAKCIWSHATFDFVVLTETLKRLDIKPRFHYRVARDLRTAVDLGKVTISKVPREGIHHDALHDCLHQVKYLVQALGHLKK